MVKRSGQVRVRVRVRGRVRGRVRIEIRNGIENHQHDLAPYDAGRMARVCRTQVRCVQNVGENALE